MVEFNEDGGRIHVEIGMDETCLVNPWHWNGAFAWNPYFCKFYRFCSLIFYFIKIIAKLLKMFLYIIFIIIPKIIRRIPKHNLLGLPITKYQSSPLVLLSFRPNKRVDNHIPSNRRAVRLKWIWWSVLYITSQVKLIFHFLLK